MGHQSRGVYVCGNDSSCLVDGEKSVGLGVASSDENGGIADSESKEGRGSGKLEAIEETELGDCEEHSVLARNLHVYGEIIGSAGVDWEIHLLLVFGCSGSRGSDLSYVDARCRVRNLAFEEAEQRRGVVISVNQRLSKARAVALKQLLLSSLNQIELDVSQDSLSAIWSTDTKE